MRTRVGSSVAALCLLAALPARADTVTIGASRDATMFSENGAQASGATVNFHSGTNSSGGVRRALVGFDLAAVPAGSTITGVTLTLFVIQTISGNLPVSLHRVTSSWTEGPANATGGNGGGGAAASAGDVTWTHRTYDTSTWVAFDPLVAGSGGGDFDPTASASTVVGIETQAYAWSSTQMVADVQGWLDGTTANHGWAVITTTSGNQQGKAYGSRQNLTASSRPALEIVFTPPASAGACCAADGTCSVAASAGECGGTFQGVGELCSPNPCPPPEGACCVPDASATCVEDTEAVCDGLGGTFAGPLSTCADQSCPVVLTPYLDPLPIPAVAQPTAGSPGGAASYTLRAVELEQTLHSELPPTRVWGYDDGTGGSFPGPTVEARTGQPIAMTWANDLRGPGGALRTAHLLPVDTCAHGATDGPPHTVVHLHGGHVASESDGYPEDAFPPGEQRLYDYPNGQDAATLWYHDHAMGITRLNVYLGLAGFYLLRDDAEDALGLPSGPYELPLALQDRSFNPDGSLAYPVAIEEHVHGDAVLVNGRVWPYLEVDRGKYRFRVLNGSGSRFYTLALSDGASFQVIGSDGGLLAAPVTVTALTLAPGERADLVLDFEGYGAGDTIELENSAPMMFPGTPGDGVVPEVLQFRVGPTLGHTDPLPGALRTIEPLAVADATAVRTLELQRAGGGPCGYMWMINGQDFDAVTEQPELGTSEIWRFVNRSGVSHPMHMHLVMFQVVDRQQFLIINGQVTPTGAVFPPEPEATGWKDTVQVPPNQIVRVIARFEDYAGLFPYHCHILEHEDNMMMRQFETVTTCGDGARGLPGETCDDGNHDLTDACPDGPDGSCAPARCGDGFVWSTEGGAETCDDGNAGSGDGCDADCQLEPAGDGGPDAGYTGGDDDGCGCRTGASPGALAAWLGALALVVRRRRRSAR